MFINSLNDIPSFLQKGDFYETLITFEHFNPIEIDEYNFKNNLMLDNINDLIHLLNTLRFWLIEYNDFPYQVIFDFVKTYCNLDYTELYDIFPELEIINEIKLLLDRNMKMFGSVRCTVAVDAAQHGYILLLKYGYKHNWFIDDVFLKKVASQYGHLNCLKYIHFNGTGNDSYKYRVSTMDMRYDLCHAILYRFSICDIAAIYGNLDCLQFLHINGYSWDWETCHLAKRYNHKNCFQYIISHDSP